MDLLKSLIVVSEKAANIARLCRQNEHLFQLLIQEKKPDEANPRFVQDFKTLADVLIQQLVKYEIGKSFPELADRIHGEENNTFSNKLGETISVEIKASEKETSDLLQIVLNGDRQAADLLAFQVHKNVFLDDVNTETPPDAVSRSFSLRDLAVWIDPIDSTAEYISGIEQVSHNEINLTGLGCVTVLIGVFHNETPVIGVVNQPFVHQTEKQWKGKCYWSIEGTHSAICASVQDKRRVICVSSSENESISAKLSSKGFTLVEASGAGYKILTVIRGQADAYVLTKDSTFKWDTCGPQAILRALGGDILVYDDLARNRRTSLQYGGGENCNRGGIVAYRDESVLNDIVDCLI